MWGVKLPHDQPFVYSLFGLQYPKGEVTSAKEQLKNTFNELITSKVTHLECVIQEDTATGNHAGNKTFVWLGYWQSKQEYLDWWTSDPVSQFWSSLPSDAGMWREIMIPDASRTQHGTNKTDTIGLGHLGSREPVGGKTGYWGCYRHRLAASVEDKFTTPIAKDARPCPATAPVQSGRVLVNHFPDNICFVLEGQDHSALLEEERSYWFENFDELAEDWIKYLVSEATGPDSGILDGRLCFDPESGIYRQSETEALNYNRKIQLFYFKDLRHMERIGRSHKGHVQLREKFLGAYGPGGAMGHGKIGLWVETTVLKADEMECEYVGCLDGTGWMAWSGQDQFQPAHASSVL